MADRYLDTSLAFPGQAQGKVDHICEMVCDISLTMWICNSPHQASEEFPVLLKFEENWVVYDYLHIYLKNSTQKAKKEQQ